MKTVNVAAAIAALGCTVNATNSSLPIVDLGYELHQALVYNETGRYYNFSNIRYAAPPVKELRFAKPQSPAVNRSTVQTGSVGRICPQSDPAWELKAAEWIPDYLLEGRTNFTSSFFASSGSNTSVSIPTQDPRSSEDCLFLDVVVPEKIFHKAGHDSGAPVMVWIFGGGYTSGSKDGSGNPAGILTRSQSDGGEGVIFVSLNYRLGAFGWLAGPTFQENGTANLGLHDQRMALEWVQKNIHLFGGDPDRVTVFGESAGGGSIMHQITAYGGHNGSAPFAQAVLQSPGWVPIASPAVQEQTFNDYLALLNVSTLEELRKLPYEALQIANIIQVANSTWGDFTFSPVVDGDFVPALPGQLLERGQFDKSVRVMVGHNADEGLLFANPLINNQTAFEDFLTNILPSLAALPNTLKYITETLYPPIFDGSQAMNYTNQITRTAALISEAVFTCNTHFLNKAYGNNTYAYLFSVPPALHGYDIAYTFYNGNGTAATSSVIAPEIAILLQEYITGFAETGDPNDAEATGAAAAASSAVVPYFPLYGKNATIQNLGIEGIAGLRDPTANARCDWWQKGLWF